MESKIFIANASLAEDKDMYEGTIQLTIPVAKYQRIIVIGRAIIYRTRLVKLNRRKMFPMKPQTKEAAFSAMHHLGSRIGCLVEYES